MISGRLWSEPVAAVLDVTFLAVITGAFHLDGLGDAADGLFSHRSREKALAIMKDSRVGIMGLVTVVCILAIKAAGIMELTSHRSLALIIVPAYARGSMIFGIKFLQYGRTDGGIGHPFFEQNVGYVAFSGLIIPVILSIFLGYRGLALNLTFAVLIFAILSFYKKKMGCITGDMLGAMTEVMESMLFLMVSIGGPIG